MVRLLSANYAHVFVMGPNPEPDEISAVLYGHGSVGRTNSSGPIASHVSKPQGRVPGVCFQEFEVTAGHLLHRIGQLTKAPPEIWSRLVHLDVLQIPEFAPGLGR